MKRFLLVGLLLTAAWGANVAGTWEGVIEVEDTSSGTTVNTPVKAVLTDQDGSIHGSIGRREDESREQIRNARMDGNALRFDVVSSENAASVKFDLTLQGDRLEGTMTGKIDTGEIRGKVHLKRAGAR